MAMLRTIKLYINFDSSLLEFMLKLLFSFVLSGLRLKLQNPPLIPLVFIFFLHYFYIFTEKYSKNKIKYFYTSMSYNLRILLLDVNVHYLAYYDSIDLPRINTWPYQNINGPSSII